MKDNFCVVCNTKFHSFSITNLISKNKIKLCEKCKSELNPKYLKFSHKTIKISAIYEYNQKFKELIYLFKGCYDYELFEVFLSPCLSYLKLRYFDYKLVCVPSTKKDDETRGYNHVKTIFSSLNLPILDLLMKSVDFKQSDLDYKTRQESINNFKLKSHMDLSKFNILLVDDIYTSGTTIEACYNLLKSLHPKNIKVLVLAKTIFKK